VRTHLAPAVVATLLVVALLSGCGDDKGPVGPDDPPTPTLSTPQAVLLSLLTAYQARDNVKTALLYDDAYEGASIDPSGLFGDFAFTKADEIRHVARLKLDPNIVSVQVDFGPQSSWLRLPADASDPPEWARIQINAWTVRVDDIQNSTTYEANNNPMVYDFKPTVAAPGDTAWAIVRWTEFAN
jgi:hypothetical protein